MLIKLKKYIKAAFLKTNFSIIPILSSCMAHIEQICGKSQEKSK
jgi:riboflavin transporter FmnP